MQSSDKWRKALTEALTLLNNRSRTIANRYGYSPKQILDQLLQLAKDERRSRNTSLQLRSALRRAVDDGLLKLRAGRYTLAMTVKQKDRKINKEQRDEQRQATSARTNTKNKRATNENSAKKSTKTTSKTPTAGVRNAKPKKSRDKR